MVVSRLRWGSLPLAAVILGSMLFGFAVIGARRPHAQALTNCNVGDYSLDSEEQAFLGMINTYRSQNGLGSLSISTNLNRSATWMVNDMAANNYFSHTDSLGRSPYQRAIDCGYPTGAGENLAGGSGWSTAQAAFDAWKASPGHNSNMLLSYYTRIGIARLYAPGSTYGWYWATDFGAVDDSAGGGAPPSTPTPTNTPTPTKTTSPTPTRTPTSTATQSSGASSTPSPMPSPTPSAAHTQGSPTNTPTASPSATNTPVSTATPTRTATPVASATTSPTPTRGPSSTPTNGPSGGSSRSGQPQASLPLSPGANLVSWPAADERPAVAVGDLGDAITIIYAWDPDTQGWLRYSPALPGFANNLQLLRRGEAYWVIAKAAAQVPVR